MYYQQQAEHPTVTSTPAGDPPDLTALDLRPADAVALLAAHISRHGTLTEWLDALDPRRTRPGGTRRRARSVHRRQPEPAAVLRRLPRPLSRRPDRPQSADHGVGQGEAGDVEGQGREHDEFGFVVHGTMADPRWLDPTVDPNDRRPGWCYQGDPRIVNMSPTGLARFTTLRSWLSQWSYDDAHGDALTARPTSRCRCSSSATRPTTRARRATLGACSTPSVMPTRSSTRCRAPRTTTPDPSSAQARRGGRDGHRLAGRHGLSTSAPAPTAWPRRGRFANFPRSRPHGGRGA